MASVSVDDCWIDQGTAAATTDLDVKSGNRDPFVRNFPGVRLFCRSE